MTVEWFGLSRITARRRLKLARASKGVFGCIVFFSLSVAACSTKNDEFKCVSRQHLWDSYSAGLEESFCSS
jgi:hypothetical protein